MSQWGLMEGVLIPILTLLVIALSVLLITRPMRMGREALEVYDEDHRVSEMKAAAAGEMKLKRSKG